MPRTKSPDPLIEEYHANGRTYVIEAGKDGSYLVRWGDRTLINVPSRIGAHFRAPRWWPSLKVQAAAMAEAKQRTSGLRDEQHQ
jgi:hypothetical protein